MQRMMKGMSASTEWNPLLKFVVNFFIYFFLGGVCVCNIKNAIVNWKCSHTNAFLPYAERSRARSDVWCMEDLCRRRNYRCNLSFGLFFRRLHLIFHWNASLQNLRPLNDGDFNQWILLVGSLKIWFDFDYFFFFVGRELKMCYILKFHWNDWVMQLSVPLWFQLIQWRFKVYRVTYD